MTTMLRDTILRMPILDVHEHHMPDVFLNRQVGLLDLLQQSYAGWTQQRPYPLPSEQRDEDPMTTGNAETTWEAIQPFVEGSGSNHFVRNVVRGIDALYDLGGAGLTASNWRDVDERIRRQHTDPEWPHDVMQRAGVERIITDPYADPMLDARSTLGPHYRSVFRINGLAMSWHPEARDHNGNSTFAFAERLGVPCETFDDFKNLMERIVETMAERNQVALKNALAYDRDLRFDEPDEALARKAWGDPNPPGDVRKAFGDFAVDRLCALAGERDIPVQMHLGSAIIRGSHPMHAAGLFERHPKTRFLLMHLAYPWSADLFGLAFVYRNLWLDLTWSWLLSPTHFKRGLHEAMEILPDDGRLMLGGDNWHAEESYATLQLARELIGEVLQEKVNAGYFSESDALRLANKILHQNARDFFRLQGPCSS